MPKDVLRIADLSRGQVQSILDLAAELKFHPSTAQRELAGGLVVLYLTETSTRTRITYASAAARLGATVVVVGPELQAGHKAGGGLSGSLDEIAHAVSSYATAIVARTGDANLDQLSTAATVPVVNGMSDSHNPGQGLADLLTLHESLGDLHGRKIAYIGDGTNACHSLLEAAALTGMDIRLVTPPGREPSADVLARAGALAARAGSRIQVTDDIHDAIDSVDAVYVGPWLSGTLPDDDQAAVASYPVTHELVARASPDAIVLHSQPRQLGVEASRDVLRAPRSRGREQAENRVHCAAALLTALNRGLVDTTRPEPLTTAG
jgi:ornithine carbamoyltransferase